MEHQVRELRPVRPDDVDGLLALYEGLSAEDRCHRFFSLFHPDREQVERWAGLTGEEGFRLVAEGRDGTLVGDVGYHLMGNGNGELDLTVAASARGWLGSYLLDAVIEAAARRGVPNLEADVLVDNGPMLALVRRRGYVTIGHEEASSVRVAIGAGTEMPTWPPRLDGPKVVVEARSGRWHGEVDARAEGMAVMVCPGPQPGPRPRCPAARGEPCPLVTGADAVVDALPRGEALADRVLETHRSHHTEVSLFVEGPLVGPAEGDGSGGVRRLRPNDPWAVTALLEELRGLEPGRAPHLPVRSSAPEDHPPSGVDPSRRGWHP